VNRFRGGLVFKARRLVYHSTLGLRVIKKKKIHGERAADVAALRLSKCGVLFVNWGCLLLESEVPLETRKLRILINGL